MPARGDARIRALAHCPVNLLVEGSTEIQPMGGARGPWTETEWDCHDAGVAGVVANHAANTRSRPSLETRTA
jgi:hypothetical protein